MKVGNCICFIGLVWVFFMGGGSEEQISEQDPELLSLSCLPLCCAVLLPWGCPGGWLLLAEL